MMIISEGSIIPILYHSMSHCLHSGNLNESDRPFNELPDWLNKNMTGWRFLYYNVFCGGEFTNEIFGCCKVIVGSIPNCLTECLARNPTLMVRRPHIFYTDVELFCMVSHASNCITKESIIPDWRLFVMFLIYGWMCRCPNILCNSRSLYLYIYIDRYR